MKNPTLQIHEFLGERYPSLFAKYTYVPLAIGISKEIVLRHADEIQAILQMENRKNVEKLIVSAIAKRCIREGYQQAMLEDGAMRVNLDGEKTELVQQEHKDNATRMIKLKKSNKSVGSAKK